jgi:hypothetical protein
MELRIPSLLLSFSMVALKGNKSFTGPPCHITFLSLATLMDLRQLPFLLKTPALIMDKTSMEMYLITMGGPSADIILLPWLEQIGSRST